MTCRSTSHEIDLSYLVGEGVGDSLGDSLGWLDGEDVGGGHSKCPYV